MELFGHRHHGGNPTSKSANFNLAFLYTNISIRAIDLSEE
jgi:hypothetical protein